MSLCCLLLPSFDEGLPLALLEAMASELPVVVADGRGIPEIFGDGGFGKLVHAGDAGALAEAMIKIGSYHEEKRREMGRLARKRIENSFTKEVMSRHLVAIYRAMSGVQQVTGVLSR
jgi:glycosyltransferase involved in cell wall biosynthesis